MAKAKTKIIKKAVKKLTKITDNAVNSFDYSAHNKKVAKCRGEEWKRKLKVGKLKTAEKPTKIRVLRVKLGWSQSDLLGKISIKSLTTLSKLEKGNSAVSFKVAREISKALTTTVPNLFTKENDKRKYIAKMVM